MGLSDIQKKGNILRNERPIHTQFGEGLFLDPEQFIPASPIGRESVNRIVNNINNIQQLGPAQAGSQRFEMIRALMAQLEGLTTNFVSPFKGELETDPEKALKNIITDFESQKTAGEELADRFPSGSTIKFTQAKRKTITDPRVSPFLTNTQTGFVKNTEFIQLRNKNRQDAIDKFFEGKDNRIGSIFFGGFGGGLIATLRSQGIDGVFGKEIGNNMVANILGQLQQVELIAKNKEKINVSDSFLSLGGLIEKANRRGYTIKRGFSTSNILTSRSIGTGLSDRTIDTFARNNNLTTAQMETLINTGSATEAVQRAVGTPQHILIRAAQRDAYLKSIDNIRDQIFGSLVATGAPGARLNRSQHTALKNRGRGDATVGFNSLLPPFQFIIDALNQVTSTGVSVLTRDELGEIGYNPAAIRSHISSVGRPRFNFELERIRKHKEDIERYNERLVAMSSGVGGF